MDKKEVIKRLNDLTSDDPEVSHGRADDLLLDFLKENGHQDLAQAWDSACDRCGFWFA